MDLYVFVVGRALLIAPNRSLSGGGELGSPRDLFLSVALYITGLLLPPSPLSQAHLIQLDLLGFWPSARVQVHPPTLTLL